MKNNAVQICDHKVVHIVDLSCSPVPQPLVETWSCHVTFYPESSPGSVVEARQGWRGPARKVFNNVQNNKYIKILKMPFYRFYAFSLQEELRASLRPRKRRETPALCVQHHATFKTGGKLYHSSNTRMN